MRGLFISVASMSIICPSICVTGTGQEGKTFPGWDSKSTEAFEGKASRVQQSAIPAKMRFQIVKPLPKFGLKQLSQEWWKFPKTTKRPPFGVVAISYSDPKYPAARILVLEWKHVSGVPASLAHVAAEGTIRPNDKLDSDNIIPVIGTRQGTDVAFYNVSLPMSRVKEMTQWVPSDTMRPDWVLAQPSTPRTHRRQPAVVVDHSFDSLRNLANTNARALATAVQGKGITDGKYDVNLEDYATDLGGSIPVNPCTGTATGYTITSTKTTATVAASAGTRCGTWTPITYSLTL